MQNISTKKVNPRDIAGNAEEVEVQVDGMLSNTHCS